MSVAGSGQVEQLGRGHALVGLVVKELDVGVELVPVIAHRRQDRQTYRPPRRRISEIGAHHQRTYRRRKRLHPDTSPHAVGYWQLPVTGPDCLSVLDLGRSQAYAVF